MFSYFRFCWNKVFQLLYPQWLEKNPLPHPKSFNLLKCLFFCPTSSSLLPVVKSCCAVFVPVVPGPSSRMSIWCGALSSCCSVCWHTFTTCPTTGEATLTRARPATRWHSCSSTKRWACADWPGASHLWHGSRQKRAVLELLAHLQKSRLILFNYNVHQNCCLSSLGVVGQMSSFKRGKLHWTFVFNSELWTWSVMAGKCMYRFTHFCSQFILKRRDIQCVKQT